MRHEAGQPCSDVNGWSTYTRTRDRNTDQPGFTWMRTRVMICAQRLPSGAPIRLVKTHLGAQDGWDTCREHCQWAALDKRLSSLSDPDRSRKRDQTARGARALHKTSSPTSHTHRHTV